MSGLRVNHVAIVVEDVDTALGFWVNALGLPLHEVTLVPAEAVNVAVLEAGEAHIELVQPTTPDSGVAKFLEKKGAGLHHLCLEVDDIEAVLVRLRENGVNLINETPRQRDNGTLYAFVHPKSTGGVLLELYQPVR